MGASIGKRGRGIPMPIMPTENIGMMSGAIRKKGESRRDKRGSRRGERRMVRSTPQGFQKPDSRIVDKIPGLTPLSKVPAEVISLRPRFDPSKPSASKGFRQPPPGYKYDEIDRLVPIDTPPLVTPRPRFDPRRPSAVQETRRVNVKDPTLGGPPEREVPIPRERRPRITRESDPRGPAPFAPDDNAAKDRFFETMFERAANQKERRAIDKAEKRDTQDSIKEEAMMREREMGGRGRRMRRTRRRDFTRRRPEKRRSREERAAFRDRYVSTLGSNFFS